MVDIHSHIIPAIDDGVRTLGEAVELIGTEAAAGTTCMVATPHVYTEEDLRATTRLPELTESLQNAVLAAGVEIRLVQGAEVYPFSSAPSGLDLDLPITIGGHRRHVLVDLPMSSLPMDFDDILFNFQSRRVTPIIAHPERNAVFQSDPEKLQEYRDRGIVLQVNAGSINGRYGERAAACARLILKRHWAHFLASDAHRARPAPILSRASQKLAETLLPAYLEILTTRSGMCVVDGKDLPDLPPPPPEVKRSWFGRIFRRDG